MTRVPNNRMPGGAWGSVPHATDVLAGRADDGRTRPTDPSYPIASGFVTFVAVALFLAMLGVWANIISGIVQ